MRTAKVHYSLISAYEIWTVRIPDDAPEDEDELKEWLEDHSNLYDWEDCDIWDSGWYDREIEEVSDIEPQPLPEMPEWWEKVYQDLVKNNVELVNKFKEQYE